MLQILHIGAALESKILTFALHNVPANLSDYHILHAYPFAIDYQVVKVLASDSSVEDLKILYGLGFEGVRQYGHSSHVELINDDVKLFAEDVLEKPVVVVRVVVVEEQMAFVRKHNYLVVSSGIYETWLE